MQVFFLNANTFLKLTLPMFVCSNILFLLKSFLSWQLKELGKAKNYLTKKYPMHYKQLIAVLCLLIPGIKAIAGPDNIAPLAKVTVSTTLNEKFKASNVT